ncbi:MAG: ABC-2 transporter permease [Anaerofustis sp.]
MKGLLLKDILGLKRFGKTILVFLGIVLLIGIMNHSDSSFYAGMIIMYTAMLTITSFSIDESSKWMQFALSMPIRRTTFVLEKYVLGLLLAFGGVLISLCMEEILIVTTHQSWNIEMLVGIAMTFFVGVIMISLFIPLLYRFGTEKARLMLILFFAVPFFGIFLMNQVFSFSIDSWDVEAMIKLSPIITLIIVSLSYIVSKKVVQKKEY